MDIIDSGIKQILEYKYASINKRISCHEQESHDNAMKMCKICRGIVKFPSEINLIIKVENRSIMRRVIGFFERRRNRNLPHSDYETDEE